METIDMRLPLVALSSMMSGTGRWEKRFLSPFGYLNFHCRRLPGKGGGPERLEIRMKAEGQRPFGSQMVDLGCFRSALLDVFQQVAAGWLPADTPWRSHMAKIRMEADGSVTAAFDL